MPAITQYYMYIEHVFLYSQREFTTGEDHTTEVHDIEKNLIGYQNSSVSVCVREREGGREGEEGTGGGREGGREGGKEGGGRVGEGEAKGGRVA